MKVYIRTPFSLDKRLGKAYNEAFAGVPDDDWVCLLDHDAMFLTPDAVTILHAYVHAYPKAGLFTCLTNRIHPLAVDQLLDGEVSDVTDIRHHIRIAEKMSTIGAKITPINHVISGFLMMVSKKTWLRFPFNEELQCLGVDNEFSQRILDAGMRILRMDALYIWHTYRLSKGISNKAHLI